MQNRILGSLESSIMEILWKREEASVRDVFEELGRKRRVAYTTVMTVMNRLMGKHLLVRKPSGNAFVYHAAKSKERFQRDVAERMIDTLITQCGNVAIAQFVDRVEKIDPETRKKLRELINGDV